MDCYRQSFDVHYEYPVVFTHGVFDAGNTALRDVVNDIGAGSVCKVMVFVDDGVTRSLPGLTEKIVGYLKSYPETFELMRVPEDVPGGERTKNGWNIVQNIMTGLGEAHMCRHSIVLAIGGGSVLDMVGFAASLIHRGVRLVRIPTTVLAQGDGGVGVKTGMDEHGHKNFVGTFAPPAAVINDCNFLKTLTDKYWMGGLSEAFKVALIHDGAFFDYLCESAEKLRVRDGEVIEKVVRQTAILHLEHIRTSGDPFEMGAARPLDFGHWAAHRLEIDSNYRLGHGQAVAIGIAMDTYYAFRVGLLQESEINSVLSAFCLIGLPIWDVVLTARTEDGTLSVVRGLEDFREHLGGQLTVTLPDGIGKGVEIHSMDHSIVEEGIKYLGELAGKV